MNCPKCQAEMPDGASFCTACGAAVAAGPAPVYAAPAEAAAPMGNAAAESPVPAASAAEGTPVPAYQPTGWDGYDRPVAAETPMDTPPVKKKGKKALAIVLAAAVVLCMLGAAGYWFYPNIKMAAMGPANYYLAAEKANYKAALSNLAANEQPKMGLNGDLTFKATGDSIPAEVQTTLEKLKINVNCGTDTANSLMSGLLDISYDGTDLAGVLLEQSGGKTALSLPGLADGKLVMAAAAQTDMKTVTGMTRDELADFAWDYAQTAIGAIPAANITGGSADYAGADGSISCATAKFHIDQKAALAAANAVAAKAKADPKLTALVTHVVDYLRTAVDQTPGLSGLLTGAAIPADSDIQGDIDKVCDQLVSDISNDTGNDTVDYTVYYGSRGDILARNISTQTASVNAGATFAEYTSKGQTVREIKADSGDGTKIGIINRYTDSNGTKNGTLKVTYTAAGNDSNPLNATYSLKEETVGGVKAETGNITLNAGLLGTGVKATVDLSKNGGSGLNADIKLDITSSGQAVGAVELTGALTLTNDPQFNISIPDQSTLDTSDLSAVLDKLCRNIDASGLLASIAPGMTAEDLLGLLTGGSSLLSGSSTNTYPDNNTTSTITIID